VAPVSSAFSTVTGHIYDQRMKAEAHICTGTGCFRTALVGTMLACSAAGLVAVALQKRRLARSAGDHARRLYQIR
jgi:hydroxyethylthiazole kinase-like sugar kinase family protein